MMTTYEFLVAETPGAAPRFLPIICESERELVGRARQLLAERNAESVEVRLAGQLLFKLVR